MSKSWYIWPPTNRKLPRLSPLHWHYTMSSEVEDKMSSAALCLWNISESSTPKDFLLYPQTDAYLNHHQRNFYLTRRHKLVNILNERLQNEQPQMRHIYHSPSSRGHCGKESRKYYKSQEWWMTKKTFFPYTIGHLHTSTHNVCDSIYKTCIGSIKTKTIPGERKWAGSSTWTWGVIDNLELLGIKLIFLMV